MPCLVSQRGLRVTLDGVRVVDRPDREDEVVGVVACTHHDEEVVVPGEPVENPSGGTHAAVEDSAVVANGQVHDPDSGRGRGPVPLVLEHPHERSQEHVDQQLARWGDLRVPPRALLQDRSY